MRQILHVKHVSTDRLAALRKLQDEAETKRDSTAVALGDAQRDADAAKAEYDESVETFLLCGHDIEAVQYQCETKRYVRRAVEAEVRAAGIAL